MEEKGYAPRRSSGRLSAWISRLFLALVLSITLLTLKTCCPEITEAARAVLGLETGGRAQAAFSVLREKLSEGEGAAAAFAETYKSLAGGQN